MPVCWVIKMSYKHFTLTLTFALSFVISSSAFLLSLFSHFFIAFFWAITIFCSFACFCRCQKCQQHVLLQRQFIINMHREIYHIPAHTNWHMCVRLCVCVCVWHINPTLVFATRDLCAASRLAVAFCLCRCQRSFNSTLAPCGRSVWTLSECGSVCSCVFICCACASVRTNATVALHTILLCVPWPFSFSHAFISLVLKLSNCQINYTKKTHT